MAEAQRNLRVRLATLQATEWAPALADETERLSGQRPTIRQPTAPVGKVGSIDPTVAAAIIGGGTAVLCAIISAAATVFAARTRPTRESDQESATILIRLRGLHGDVSMIVRRGEDLTAEKVERAVIDAGDPTDLVVEASTDDD